MKTALNPAWKSNPDLNGPDILVKIKGFGNFEFELPYPIYFAQASRKNIDMQTAILRALENVAGSVRAPYNPEAPN